MTAREQLNGLVLLYAYLQRIFVYDKVLATVPGPRTVPPTTTDPGALLERVSAAIAAFDTRDGLPAATVTEFDDVVAWAGAAMADRAARPGAPLRERLAAIAGDRFHHRHLVEGLVFWGDRYRAETADRFRQRILPAREATAVLTDLVARAAAGPLPDDDLRRIDGWYDEVVAAAGSIPSDIALTGRLLHGEG